MGSMGGGSVKDQWRDSGDGVHRVGVVRSEGQGTAHPMCSIFSRRHEVIESGDHLTMSVRVGSSAEKGL